MQYQPQIDGLRAISVAAVIVYHANANWLPGGFLGVDVFFVISGYLITGILLRDIDNGRFSIGNFYERRVRRIAPALICMMLLTIALAPLLLPHQIMDLGQSLAAAMTFSSNFFFYVETDYFNAFTNVNPLLHTWSLAVEEQYYLLYPLILLALSRISRRAVFLGLVGILVSSFAMAVITTTSNPQLSFYATHTRAWELMAGSLLAFGTTSGPLLAATCRFHQQSLDVLSALALATLGASIVFITPDMAHPGWATVVPVGATVVLLACAGQSRLLGVILGHPGMVYAGLLSYSLYMYHQPLLSYAHLAASSSGSEGTLTGLELSGVIAATVCLSVVSYHYIEKPLRHARSISRRAAFAGFGATATILVALGMSAHFSKGYMSYFVERYADSDGVKLVDVSEEKEALAIIRRPARAEQHAPFNPDARLKVLLVGDSFALDAYLALRAGSDRDVSARLLDADDGCMDALAADLSGASDTVACVRHASRAQIAQLLSEASDILVSAQWLDSTYTNFLPLVDALRGHTDANVRAIGSVQFNDISSVALLLARNGISADASGPVMYRNLRLDRLRSSNRLRQVLDSTGDIGWIEKRRFFCDETTASCQLFDSAGRPLIWDHGHLTVHALEPYGRFILRQLNESVVAADKNQIGSKGDEQSMMIAQGESS